MPAFSQHHNLPYSKRGGLLISFVKLLCILSTPQSSIFQKGEVFYSRSSNCRAFSQHQNLPYSNMGGLLISFVKLPWILSTPEPQFLKNRRFLNFVRQSTVHFLNTPNIQSYFLEEIFSRMPIGVFLVWDAVRAS